MGHTVDRPRRRLAGPGVPRLRDVRVSSRTSLVRGLAVAVAACLTLVVPAPQRVDASAPLHPSRLRPELVAGARQLLVVVPAYWRATTARVDRWELRDGTWVRRNISSYTARLGRTGTRVVRREGDGSTPAGSFPLLAALGTERTRTTRLGYTRIRDGHCWISDVADPSYNRLVVRERCGTANEDLHRIALAGPYRRVVVTGYNTSPIVPGLGSAIFLHLHSRHNGSTVPTSGCISLDSAPMDATWRWLDPGQAPRVVIGPAAWLTGT